MRRCSIVGKVVTLAKLSRVGLELAWGDAKHGATRYSHSAPS